MLRKCLISNLLVLIMTTAASEQVFAQSDDVQPSASLSGYTSLSSAHPGLQGPGSYITSQDGTLIAVQDLGPRDGLPILFIHGFTHNSEVWYQQLASEHLSGFRLITMDLRGHGFSGKPTEASAYANSVFADDINAVIHALHLHKPVLAGWSLGGEAVQGYLVKYGDNEIGGVDLVDSIACPDVACQQTILGGPVLAQVVPLLISSEAATEEQGAISFLDFESGGTAQSSSTLNPAQRLVLEDSILTMPPSTRLIIATNFARQVNVVPAMLENLQVPLLVQHGANDPLFPQSLIPGEVKLVKHATVRLYPNTGHIPFFLDAATFNRDLAQWIRQNVQ
jgi:pimeloyl-ACP methyl ester carboxylesterase